MLKVTIEVDEQFLRVYHELYHKNSPPSTESTTEIFSQSTPGEHLKGSSKITSVFEDTRPTIAQFLKPETQIELEKAAVNFRDTISEIARNINDPHNPVSKIFSDTLNSLAGKSEIGEVGPPPGETADSVAVLAHLDRLRLGDELD